MIAKNHKYIIKYRMVVFLRHDSRKFLSRYYGDITLATSSDQVNLSPVGIHLKW